MTPRNQKVVVGLSGGVDSAIAAARLKAQGWDVTTLFMKNWEEDDDAEYCAAREDLAMAQQVVEALDIPLRTVNFAHEYWERVFAIFLREYEAGRTPNPDVLCNREIKFKEYKITFEKCRITAKKIIFKKNIFFYLKRIKSYV